MAILSIGQRTKQMEFHGTLYRGETRVTDDAAGLIVETMPGERWRGWIRIPLGKVSRLPLGDDVAFRLFTDEGFAIDIHIKDLGPDHSGTTLAGSFISEQMPLE